jgi:hypothetical protein
LKNLKSKDKLKQHLKTHDKNRVKEFKWEVHILNRFNCKFKDTSKISWSIGQKIKGKSQCCKMSAVSIGCAERKSEITHQNQAWKTTSSYLRLLWKDSSFEIFFKKSF